ncbi:MAG: thiamine pyrophosphate-dependent enzyme [Pseudomonadota bacterium]
MVTRSGAEILVRALSAQGVTTAFGVPGESYLAVLDALCDTNIRFVLCRQEGGVAFMAEAWGKLTGTPGIAFVTRGPGATNAAIGVHTAMQNSSPMILFVGQIETGMREREAFQEVDYRAAFGPIAKWATEIESADRVAEVVARAWHTALSGRPGPVVVALPEDVLSAMHESMVHEAAIRPAWPGVDPAAVERARAALDAAERPVVLLGGGGWDTEGRGGRKALRAFQQFCERTHLPVVVTFRGQDLIDNRSDAYIGDAGFGMAPHVRDVLDRSDLILAVNIRFGETATDGYTLFGLPTPEQRLIHVHPSDRELGKVYQTPDTVHASPAAFLAQLSETTVQVPKARIAWATEARGAFTDTFDLPPQPGALDMGVVMAHLREVLPEDAIIANGAGNFAIWPGRLLHYSHKRRLLAPQSGAMGAGLPAAIAARIAEPNRLVLCFAGDGDIQMTMQELGTAMQANAQPIVLVLNNGSYGTIRMHQEKHYPGRVSGTELENPDFVAIGRAYGMHAERVETAEDFVAAFERARASGTGALLEMMIDKEAITPRRTLSEIRAAAMT